MSDLFKNAGIALFAVITLIIAMVMMTGANTGLRSFFGVWNADIERNIFEKSKSHIYGTIQALNDLKLQYEIAENQGHKKALREAILTEYSAFKYKSEISGNLTNFINSL